MYGVEWAFDVMGPNPPPSILKEIVMTHLEMKVFLRLLKLNAFISPPGVEQEASSTEERFKASVLFPLGPLLFEDVSKLNNIVGCVVCGKKEESRCSRCLTVSYCGRGTRLHLLLGLQSDACLRSLSRGRLVKSPARLPLEFSQRRAVDPDPRQGLCARRGRPVSLHSQSIRRL